MGKIRRLVPFNSLPANWGLTGTRRAIAEAEYYYDGEDLDRQLLEINHPDQESKDYKLAAVKLDRKYNKIGEFDFEYGLVAYNPLLTETARNIELSKLKHRFGKISAEDLDYELLDHRYENHGSEEYQRERLTLDVKHKKVTEAEKDHKLLQLRFEDHDCKDFKLAELDLKFKHAEIDQNTWEKETATLNEEPWFNVVGADARGGKSGQQLAIELDWNEYFPRFLEQCGWAGTTDDEIVDTWFSEAMRQMIVPDLDLTDEQLQAMEDEDYMPQRGTQRRRREDGRSEYS